MDRLGYAAMELSRSGQTLRASIGYSFVGQTLYLASQLGVLSALAHFRGPSAVGEFGLALALTTPLFLLSNLGFRTAQASDVSEDFTFTEYGGVRLVLTVLAIIVSIVLGLVFASGQSALWVVAVVTLMKGFEAVSNLSYGAFQQAGRMDLVALSLGLRGCLAAMAFTLLLTLGAETPTAFVAQLVVWGVIALGLDYPRACLLAEGRFVLPKWSHRRSVRLIRHASPLGGGLFANSLQMSVPRLMVERFLGLEALGIFTAVGYFQQAGVTASNSLSHAIVNRLARLNRAGKERQARRLLLKLFVLVLSVGAAGSATAYWFGDIIMRVLFGPHYASAGSLLFVISIAVSLRMLSTLPQTALLAERRFRQFFLFQMISLGLTVVLGFYLIPKFGVLGAGYVLIASAAFRLIFLELVALIGRTPLQPQPAASAEPSEA